MKKDYELPEAEFRFMNIVWEQEPLLSRRLAELSEELMGWTHSTAYTILSRLVKRGIAVNENTVVRSVISREEVLRLESHREIERKFNGSFSAFLLSYYADQKISRADAEKLKRIIDEKTEKED